MPRAKTNRTDLMAPKAPLVGAGQPNGQAKDGIPRVATGQPYGQAGQQQADLKTAPTAQPGTPAIDLSTSLKSRGWAKPNLTPLDAPTERPGEHVTTGNIGTPSAIPSSQILQLKTGDVSDTLTQLSQMTGSAELQGLAAIAKGAGH